jgi:hypothetical protein
MPHGTHNSSLCISPTNTPKLYTANPTPITFNFCKKKHKMLHSVMLLHSEMPQSEMLDSLMLAGFRDATCFSLPELTPKEPDCKYTSGSLKIGFHQRIGVWNFTFGSFLLDTQILNVKKQLRLQKSYVKHQLYFGWMVITESFYPYPYKQNNKHFSMWVLLLV